MVKIEYTNNDIQGRVLSHLYKLANSIICKYKATYKSLAKTKSSLG